MKKNAHKRQIIQFAVYRILSQGALIISLTALISVIVFILVRGFPYVDMQLLFGEWGSKPSIKPAFTGTLYIIFISISIAAPIGIGSAVFLTEYTNSRSRLVRVVRVAVETLAGIPSIVYGIFGYLVFVTALGFRYSILGGGITLAVMILPVIVRSTEESLLAVPQTLREGSFALGSSKVRTIFSVILPCAASGIVTALILAAGRVISESAALLMTIGMVVNRSPSGFMSPGTSLALNVYYFGSHGYPEQAAATAVVLLCLVVSINISATILGKIFGKGELADG
ncbi:MAG: phosphate ABC transporter permease PstA [Oscillospiraceae bacterium]|nr:phosphate ABC transporter permease PstA [Oscillospiraceae bacterium]